jgi:hypothetical protein
MGEGEDDPDSYEIPKLEQDLTECLRDSNCAFAARHALYDIPFK